MNDEVVEQAVLLDRARQFVDAAERFPDLLGVRNNAVERDSDDVAHPALT
ncbi:MAG: hypothetical protein WDO69_18895 [Pseudomonadota bacterium]